MLNDILAQKKTSAANRGIQHCIITCSNRSRCGAVNCISLYLARVCVCVCVYVCVERKREKKKNRKRKRQRQTHTEKEQRKRERETYTEKETEREPSTSIYNVHTEEMNTQTC